MNKKYLLIPIAAIALLSITAAKASRVDFNDASAWNGGTGFTYAFTDVDGSEHTSALPYVVQNGTFDGIGLTITYEHSMGFSQGVVVNEYETVSNLAELNTYGLTDDRGLVRIAGDWTGDIYGNNDGYSTMTLEFDQDVYIQDFLLGSIDSNSSVDRSDNIEVKASAFGGATVVASAENLDFLAVASGDAQVTDGAFGRHFFPQAGGGQNHAVTLDWTTTAIRKIEVQMYGTNLGVVHPGGGYSAALAGFVVNPVPEPTSALLLGLAAFGFLSRRRR